VVAAARAHVFVADLATPELDDADRHHLARVLRLAPGDEITVSDGAGRWRRCRFGPVLQPIDDVQVEARDDPPVTIAFALTKGTRPEWTVQKLTELGVDAIVPFVAERSVVKWTPERAGASVERWRRIAREAASQSRRAWLPALDDLCTFGDVVHRPGAALAEVAGAPPSLAWPVVLVGPEGGWSEDEQAAAAALPRVRLGPHVLRSPVVLVGMRRR
jgi:16S rRNA (uracil1498-N3)-methyltransferase